MRNIQHLKHKKQWAHLYYMWGKSHIIVFKIILIISGASNCCSVNQLVNVTFWLTLRKLAYIISMYFYAHNTHKHFNSIFPWIIVPRQEIINISISASVNVWSTNQWDDVFSFSWGREAAVFTVMWCDVSWALNFKLVPSTNWPQRHRRYCHMVIHPHAAATLLYELYNLFLRYKDTYIHTPCSVVWVLCTLVLGLCFITGLCIVASWPSQALRVDFSQSLCNHSLCSFHFSWRPLVHLVFWATMLLSPDHQLHHELLGFHVMKLNFKYRQTTDVKLNWSRSSVTLKKKHKTWSLSITNLFCENTWPDLAMTPYQNLCVVLIMMKQCAIRQQPHGSKSLNKLWQSSECRAVLVSRFANGLLFLSLLDMRSHDKPRQEDPRPLPNIHAVIPHNSSTVRHNHTISKLVFP